MFHLVAFLGLLAAGHLANADCISSGDQTTINNLLKKAGDKVQLCPGATIKITNSIEFTADDQEISTQGYPTGPTRATIIAAPGSNFGNALITGRHNENRVLNIQVDGNRPNLGYLHGASANIEMGGASQGQVIQHVASRNPRGWSCLHLIESGIATNPCRNATVSYNDIGPCGQSSKNSAGQGLWADGISMGCTESVVSNNEITGSTDGGIVLFGAPGTIVTKNIIRSSATDKAFGGVNLVDLSYGGNYSGVEVTGNTFIGDKLLALGIGLGGCVWSGRCTAAHSGPTTVRDNTFSGNIAFAIVINGWKNGITVQDNDVSRMKLPVSSFASTTGCPTTAKQLASKNAALSHYPPGVQGPSDLQSNFVESPGNDADFICPTPL